MDIPTEAELIETIEAFLNRHAMKATTFGALATRDPGLIKSIRDGRSPSLKRARRLRDFMNEYEKAKPSLAADAHAQTAGAAA